MKRHAHSIRTTLICAVVFGLGWFGGCGWSAFERLAMHSEIRVLERTLAEEQFWHDKRRAELEALRGKP